MPATLQSGVFPTHATYIHISLKPRPTSSYYGRSGAGYETTTALLFTGLYSKICYSKGILENMYVIMGTFHSEDTAIKGHFQKNMKFLPNHDFVKYTPVNNTAVSIIMHGQPLFSLLF